MNAVQAARRVRTAGRDEPCEITPLSATRTAFVMGSDPDAPWVFDAVDRSLSRPAGAAGDCPALLVFLDGRAEWVPAAPGRVAVPAPVRLVLFNEAVVAEDGLRALHAVAVESCSAPVETAADRVLATLTRDGARSSAALVVADLVPAPDPLVEEIPATADAVGPLRASLRRWLAASYVPDDVADEVVIATNEAVANAVEHGSLGPSSSVRVRAERAEGAVRIEVVDSGGLGTAHDDPDRGRGLQLIRALMDKVDVRLSTGGTTVRMEHAVGESVLHPLGGHQ